MGVQKQNSRIVDEHNFASLVNYLVEAGCERVVRLSHECKVASAEVETLLQEIS
jgi:hypothetical protein